MGRILEPLLWRDQRQTHTQPSESINEIDFDMASDEAILILAYEATSEVVIGAADSVLAAALSVDPNNTFATLGALADDEDVVALFTWQNEITTTGHAGQVGHARQPFADPGLLIIDNPSVHLITTGAAITRAILHRIWYKIVRLTELETAGLIIRRRRQ